MEIEATRVVSSVILEPKRALAVFGVTTATGVAEYLRVLPWGKIAAVVGIISTIIMAIIHVVRLHIDLKKSKDETKMRTLEREIKHLEIEALKDAADDRHHDGEE